MAQLFRSQLVIKIVNQDGSEVEGSTNQLLDDTSGLTQEQAAEHHYALKKAYATALANAGNDEIVTFKSAVG